jgi:hypothetical protein
MHTVMTPSKVEAVETGVQKAATPSYFTTTLYDVMTAIQDAVGPGDDARVVAIVVHLLRSGRLTRRGTACTRGRRTA